MSDGRFGGGRFRAEQGRTCGGQADLHAVRRARSRGVRLLIARGAALFRGHNLDLSDGHEEVGRDGEDDKDLKCWGLVGAVQHGLDALDLFL